MKKAAFQMDHPSRLNPRTDSTLMLIEEACARGIECYYFSPLDVSLTYQELTAYAHAITVRDGNWSLAEPASISLHGMDVVWLRQDPPFNMEYVTSTYLLEQLIPDTKLVNNPAAVRNAPEKLSALHYPQFLPPTLVSLDEAAIHAFIAQHATVIAKPLHGYGGRGVFRFTRNDPNIDTLIEHWRETYHEPLMWQRFLPEVGERDTRVILIDGKVAGAFTRIPKAGSIRANMRIGGTPQKTTLSETQTAICNALAPRLAKEGLLFVGLDLIGDFLTEINVTSPTGLRAMQELYGRNLAAQLWDTLS